MSNFPSSSKQQADTTIMMSTTSSPVRAGTFLTRRSRGVGNNPKTTTMTTTTMTTKTTTSPRRRRPRGSSPVPNTTPTRNKVATTSSPKFHPIKKPTSESSMGSNPNTPPNDNDMTTPTGGTTSTSPEINDEFTKAGLQKIFSYLPNTNPNNSNFNSDNNDNDNNDGEDVDDDDIPGPNSWRRPGYDHRTELLSTEIVVDIVNAGVSHEHIPLIKYYHMADKVLVEFVSSYHKSTKCETKGGSKRDLLLLGGAGAAGGGSSGAAGSSSAGDIHASIEEEEDALDEAFIYGHRLLVLLLKTLPSHPRYKHRKKKNNNNMNNNNGGGVVDADNGRGGGRSIDYKHLREKSVRDVRYVHSSMKDIVERMDKLQFNRVRYDQMEKRASQMKLDVEEQQEEEEEDKGEDGEESRNDKKKKEGKKDTKNKSGPVVLATTTTTTTTTTGNGRDNKSTTLPSTPPSRKEKEDDNNKNKNKKNGREEETEEDNAMIDNKGGRGGNVDNDNDNVFQVVSTSPFRDSSNNAAGGRRRQQQRRPNKGGGGTGTTTMTMTTTTTTTLKGAAASRLQAGAAAKAAAAPPTPSSSSCKVHHNKENDDPFLANWIDRLDALSPPGSSKKSVAKSIQVVTSDDNDDDKRMEEEEEEEAGGGVPSPPADDDIVVDPNFFEGINSGAFAKQDTMMMMVVDDDDDGGGASAGWGGGGGQKDISGGGSSTSSTTNNNGGKEEAAPKDDEWSALLTPMISFDDVENDDDDGMSFQQTITSSYRQLAIGSAISFDYEDENNNNKEADDNDNDNDNYDDDEGEEDDDDQEELMTSQHILEQPSGRRVMMVDDITPADYGSTSSNNNDRRRASGGGAAAAASDLATLLERRQSGPVDLDDLVDEDDSSSRGSKPSAANDDYSARDVIATTSSSSRLVSNPTHQQQRIRARNGSSFPARTSMISTASSSAGWSYSTADDTTSVRTFTTTPSARTYSGLIGLDHVLDDLSLMEDEEQEDHHRNNNTWSEEKNLNTTNRQDDDACDDSINKKASGEQEDSSHIKTYNNMSPEKRRSISHQSRGGRDANNGIATADPLFVPSWDTPVPVVTATPVIVEQVVEEGEEEEEEEEEIAYVPETHQPSPTPEVTEEDEIEYVPPPPVTSAEQGEDEIDYVPEGHETSRDYRRQMMEEDDNLYGWHKADASSFSFDDDNSFICGDHGTSSSSTHNNASPGKNNIIIMDDVFGVFDLNDTEEIANATDAELSFLPFPAQESDEHPPSSDEPSSNLPTKAVARTFASTSSLQGVGKEEMQHHLPSSTENIINARDHQMTGVGFRPDDLESSFDRHNKGSSSASSLLEEGDYDYHVDNDDDNGECIEIVRLASSRSEHDESPTSDLIDPPLVSRRANVSTEREGHIGGSHSAASSSFEAMVTSKSGRGEFVLPWMDPARALDFQEKHGQRRSQQDGAGMAFETPPRRLDEHARSSSHHHDPRSSPASLDGEPPSLSPRRRARMTNHPRTPAKAHLSQEETRRAPPSSRSSGILPVVVVASTPKKESKISNLIQRFEGQSSSQAKDIGTQQSKPDTQTAMVTRTPLRKAPAKSRAQELPSAKPVSFVSQRKEQNYTAHCPQKSAPPAPGHHERANEGVPCIVADAGGRFDVASILRSRKERNESIGVSRSSSGSSAQGEAPCGPVPSFDNWKPSASTSPFTKVVRKKMDAQQTHQDHIEDQGAPRQRFGLVGNNSMSTASSEDKNSQVLSPQRRCVTSDFATPSKSWASNDSSWIKHGKQRTQVDDETRRKTETTSTQLLHNDDIWRMKDNTANSGNEGRGGTSMVAKSLVSSATSRTAQESFSVDMSDHGSSVVRRTNTDGYLEDEVDVASVTVGRTECFQMTYINDHGVTQSPSQFVTKNRDLSTDVYQSFRGTEDGDEDDDERHHTEAAPQVSTLRKKLSDKIRGVKMSSAGGNIKISDPPSAHSSHDTPGKSGRRGLSRLNSYRHFVRRTSPKHFGSEGHPDEQSGQAHDAVEFVSVRSNSGDVSPIPTIVPVTIGGAATQCEF